jgi:hypothetical protein
MFWRRNPQPKKNEGEAKPEPKSAKPAPRSMRYYEHDGALRAYANRAMVIAFLSVPTTFLAVAFAAYVRLQPPTVIRVDANGEAAVVGQKLVETSLVNVAKGAGAEPSDFDKKAFMRVFLEHYLNFSGSTVDRNWADALDFITTTAP